MTRPHIVLGDDDRGSLRSRERCNDDPATDRGDRRVDVHHVELAGSQQSPELCHPAHVRTRSSAETLRHDAGFGEGGNEIRLLGQQVRNARVRTFRIACTRVQQQQAFGTARAESLDQP